jgi:tripartite-type tricarboxylate transporter receptor subunit TctC
LHALKELGTPELQLTAQLLGGVLEAATGAIESGASLTAVTERTLTLVHAAVAGGAADVA